MEPLTAEEANFIALHVYWFKKQESILGWQAFKYSVYSYSMSLPVRLLPAMHPAQLKMLGQISCGFPSPAADYQLPDLSLDDLVGIRPTSSIFLFQACGNSMVGAGIHDGDVLVVDKAKQSRPGNVVLAIVGAEFLVKRLQFDRKGRAMLMAENDQYPPLVLGEDEVLQVWGVCVWVLHNLVG